MIRRRTTQRGGWGGRQCETIDAIAYNVAYIATIACNTAQHLSCNCTEHNSSHRVGKVDKKTHQKWSELFVEAILYLECEVVSFFLT
jgi:hypothetical protein